MPSTSPRRVGLTKICLKCLRSDLRAGRNLRKGLALFNASDLEFVTNTRLHQRNPPTLAKSKICGIGLFTIEPVEKTDFVVKYVGEIIQRPLLDVREKRYKARGVSDSFLFRPSEKLVINSTRKGYMARFINHSCKPNVYTKIICERGIENRILRES